MKIYNYLPKHQTKFLSIMLSILLFLVSCSKLESDRSQNTVLSPPVYEKVQKNLRLLPVKAKGLCQSPTPYKGDLVFRSRYEGSGRSRDQLNAAAERTYLDKSKSLLELQLFLAKETDAIIKGKADQKSLDCVLQTLLMWAKESDLLQQTNNHTGKAARKWTLAAISSNLLKIDRMAEQYDAQTFSLIKVWVGKLAEQVVADYSNISLKKTNNHSYWAAWAVMTSAALLDRKDLFVWSKQMYSTAMGQVDNKGFLPNELRRKTRAGMYHNYALMPLMGIAAFLEANNVDPFQFNNNALRRLSDVVIESIDNLDIVEREAGAQQVPYNLESKGRLSWLAIYSTLEDFPSRENSLKIEKLCDDLVPLKSSRMGGDVGFTYLGL